MAFDARPRPARGADSTAPAPNLGECPGRPLSSTCSQCGHATPKWHGQCPGCGEWNTLVEEARAAPPRRARAVPAGARRRSRSCCATSRAAPCARLATGIGELDRVLGGGLVPGSLVLLGGSPGIGKSTLTAMALGHLAGGGPRARSTSPARSRRRRSGCAPSGWGAARARRAGRGRDRPRRRARHARGRAPDGRASSTRCRRCTPPS